MIAAEGYVRLAAEQSLLGRLALFLVVSETLLNSSLPAVYTLQFVICHCCLESMIRLLVDY